MKGLIFTYLLTYGGAVASLVNPFYGLLVYICFSIIRPESLWHWSVPAGNYSRIVAIAMLIGWALHGFGNWNFRGAKPIVIALLGYWGWMIVSAVQAPHQAVAWQSVEIQTKIILPFVVGMTLIDSTARLKQIAWVIAISQGYVALEANLAYYGGSNWVHSQGFGGMDNNCISIAMVTGAGLTFFLGLHERVWWRKLIAFAAAALMAHIPMIADSRGGMLALCVVGAVSFFIIPKQPKHYLTFALAVVLALRLAGTEVVERFATTFTDEEQRDASAQSRLDLWEDMWDCTLKHPVAGIGPDHWMPTSLEYGWERMKEGHSLWFQTGAELGFPGVTFLMSFYGLACWRLWRLTRDRESVDPVFTDSARMVIAAMSGFVVSVSFVSLEALEIPYYTILLGAGVLKLTDEQRSQGPPSETEHFDEEYLETDNADLTSEEPVVTAIS